MKKYLLLFFILSSSIYLSFGQVGQDNTNTNAGSPGALGNYGTALGSSNDVPGQYAFIGGSNSFATGSHSFGFGKYVKASADFSFVLGSGRTVLAPLENSIPHSFMIGFNTTRPSFFVESFNGMSDGYVGIHTDDPHTELDVNGVLTTNQIIIDGTEKMFTMPYGATNGWVLTCDADGKATWQDPVSGPGSHSPGYWTNNGDNIYFNNIENHPLGNVGIGLLNPLEKLHIGGINANLRVDGYIRGGGTAGSLMIQTDYTGYVEIGIQSNNAARFATDKLRFEFNKKVEVTKTLSFNDTQNAQIEFGSNNKAKTLKIVSKWTDGHKSSISGMAISPTGQVGIGTDTPQAELDINGKMIASGDIETNSNLQVDGNILNDGRISTTGFKLQNPTTGDGKILQSDADGVASWVEPEESGISYWDKNSTGHIYRKNGFVGIGTNQPQAPLHIEFGTGHAGIKFTTDEETYSQPYPIQFITGVSGNHAKLTQYIPNKGGDYIWTCQPHTGNNKIEGMRLAVSPWGTQGILSINGKLNTDKFKLISETDVNGYILQADADGDAHWVEPSDAGISAWEENATNADVYRVAGNVGIGTSATADAKLTVRGKIIAMSMDITDDVPASDYVFEEDYQLMSLNELETYVNKNKHLPEVKSAKEFKENGYNIGKMDDMLLRKIEELTLYVIEQQKMIDELRNDLKKQSDN